MENFDQIDSELDGMDNVDVSIESEDSGDRNVVTETTLDVMKSVSEEFKTKSIASNLGDVLKGAIPNVVGVDRYNSISSMVDDVTKDVMDVKDDIKRNAYGIVDTAKELAPKGGKIESILTSLADRLAPDVTGGDATTQYEKDDPAEAFAQGVFQNQNKPDIASIIGVESSVKTSEASIKVNTAIFEMLKYQSSMSEVYYRKSLELKYRHIIVSNETKTLLDVGIQSIVAALDGIKQNTALPDIVKVRSSEAMVANIKQNMYSDLYTRQIRNSGWMESLKSNVTNKVNAYGGGLRDILAGGGAGLEAYRQNKDLLDTFSGDDMGFDLEDLTPEEIQALKDEGISLYSPKTALGNIAATSGDGIRGTIGSFASSLLMRTEKGRKLRSKIDEVMISPSSYFGKKAAELDGSEGLKDKTLQSIFGYIADITTAGGMYSDTSIDTINDPNVAAVFDNKTKTAITFTIPDYLAKIYATLRSWYLGEDVAVERYDYTKQKMVSTDNVAAELQSELGTSYIKSGLIGNVDSTVTGMLNDSGLIVNDTERNTVNAALLKAASYNRNLSFDTIMSGEGLEELTDEERTLLQKVVKESVTEEGEVNYTKVGQLEDQFTRIVESKTDATKRIKTLIEDGFGDDLERIGIVKRNDDGSYTVNAKEVNTLGLSNIEELFNPQPVTIKDRERLEAKQKLLKAMDAMSNKAASVKDEVVKKVSSYDTENIKTTVDDVKNFSKRKYEEAKSVVETIDFKDVHATEVDEIVKAVKETFPEVDVKSINEWVLDKIPDMPEEEKVAKIKPEKEEVVEKGEGTPEKETINNTVKGIMEELPEKIAEAIEKAAPKEDKVRYDTNNDGYRDGSWQERLAKLKKTPDEDKPKGTKNSDTKNDSSSSGIFMKILGVLGGLGGYIVGGIGKSLKGLLGINSFLGKAIFKVATGGIPLIGTMLGGISKLAYKSFKALMYLNGGLSSLMKFLVRTAAGTVVGAPGFFGKMFGKIKSLGKFLFGSKLKSLATVAGLAGGAWAYFSSDDDTTDTTLDNMYNDMNDTPTNEANASQADMANPQDMGDMSAVDMAMTGAMVAPAGYTAVKKVLSKTTKEDTSVLKKATKVSGKAKTAAAESSSIISKVAPKVGKRFMKRIPLVGTAMGLGEAAISLAKGNFKDAGVGVLDAVISLVPALSMAMLGKDIYDTVTEASESTDTTEQPKKKRDARGRNKPTAPETRSLQETAGGTPTAKAPAHGTRHKKAAVESITHSVTQSKEQNAVKELRYGVHIKSPIKIDKADRMLFELIAKGESKPGMAGYKVVYGGRKYLPKGTPEITKLSLTSILVLQGEVKRRSKLSDAMGKYQFVNVTLKELIAKTKIDPGISFSPDVQDYLVKFRLTDARKYNSWKHGSITDDMFIAELANEFASIPTPTTGKSAHRGVHGNKARVTLKEVRKTLAEMRAVLGLPESEFSMTEAPQQEATASQSNMLVSNLKAAVEGLFAMFGITKPKAIDRKQDTSVNVSDSPVDESKPNATKRTQASRNRHAGKRTGTILQQGDTKGEYCGVKVVKKNIPAIREYYVGKGYDKIVPKHLVIHNTASKNISWSWAKKTKYGTQVWIDRDGTIYVLNGLDHMIYHVGKHPKMPSVSSSNSIGIEMVSAWHEDTGVWDKYTEAQKKSLLKIAGCIMAKYGLTVDDVYYHDQVSYKKPLEGKEGAALIKGEVYIPENTDTVMPEDGTATKEVPTTDIFPINTSLYTPPTGGMSEEDKAIDIAGAGIKTKNSMVKPTKRNGPLVENATSIEKMAEANRQELIGPKEVVPDTFTLESLDDIGAVLRKQLEIQAGMLEHLSMKAKAVKEKPPEPKKVKVDKNESARRPSHGSAKKRHSPSQVIPTT